MPLFSIVIVNYNHGIFLESAIQSIVNQSNKDYELIIVDGGSSDKSKEIIQNYESKLSWWTSEPDNGQSQAFNKGFSHAHGEYFMWVNADDLLLPNSLSIAKDYIIKYKNFKWFAANTIFFSKDGLINKCAYGPNGSISMLKNTDINIYGPTSIFHRNIFLEVGGFDEKLKFAMDTDLWTRFAKSGYRFKRINHYFWGFRIHEQSKTSHAYTSKPIEEFFNEQEYIIKKNELKYSHTLTSIKYILKLLDGSYLVSFLDTKRLKGRDIYKHE